MVPFLNAILGTMLPMLSMAKQDNIKWVFSSGKNLPSCFFEIVIFVEVYPPLKLLKHYLQVFTSKNIKLSPPLFLSSFVITLFSTLPNFPFPLFCSLPSALCHFSDSILEYLANLDKAPDPTVRKDTFSSEIYAAFDILFNNWLQSRESKVRLL